MKTNLRCTECGRYFQNGQGLSSHLRNTHNMDEEEYRRSFRQIKLLFKAGIGDLVPFDNSDIDELKHIYEEEGSSKWYSDQILGTERRVSFAEVQSRSTGQITSVEIEKYQEKFLRRRRRLDEAILQRSPKE